MLSIANEPITISVVMLNVVRLNVVAPKRSLTYFSRLAYPEFWIRPCRYPGANVIKLFYDRKLQLFIIS
jgi:hypothetical protein